jgi:beta-galactosidase
VTAGDRVAVALTLVQAASAEVADQVNVTVRGPAGREIATMSSFVPRGARIEEMGSIAFAADAGPGEYRVVARLLRGEEVLAETTESVLALSAPDWSAIPDTIAVGGVTTLAAQNGQIVAPNPGSLSREEWDTLLAAVEAGAVGVIGPLRPENDLALAALAERGVKIDLHFGIGNWMGCYHWIPTSDMFAGLPAGGLAGEAYADVLPHYVMTELGGEVFAGSFRNTQTRLEAPAMIWYSDVEVIPFGRGQLLFCQYRLFDRAAHNPLAGTLLANLLRVAGAMALSA